MTDERRAHHVRAGTMTVPEQQLGSPDLPNEEVSSPETAESTRAISIVGNAIVVGNWAVRFYSEHADDVLVAYLELVRHLRQEQPAAGALCFRRVDVDELARFLVCGGTDVLNGLAALMGASRLREASMVACYNAGDLVIDSGLSDVATESLVEEALPDDARKLLSDLTSN